jgi:outer membrane receptor protein involved in Fe transport
MTLLLPIGPVKESRAHAPRSDQEKPSQLKQLSLEQLGNIEVTSESKKPVKVSRTPAAVYVLTQDDIRRSGATSIPEALRLVPGVEIARIDSGKWSVGVRGFGSRLSRSVLVLIDGRTVYTPLFAGVYWEVQDTLLEDIERIEVIRGPGGTIWGANAVNGVINIITKGANNTHGMLASVSGRWWRLAGSYSFLHMDLGRSTGSRDFSSPNSTEGSSPQHQVVIQSFVELPKKLDFDQTYRYVSALPAQLVGSYRTADVRLGWRATGSRELSIAGQNLFEPHHAEFGKG